ncbi:ABC transporter substrate-binding protein [Paenibacillus oenotherae]|uniref:ABC transporter substrate-binding protein n=1 Tax=Paenibacillus oenotherae TaxID=1435645 RepID=A0ABS7D6I1_9BACL|nr:ABC transporter substrate-binding protein [Paenibacillus oenotherae]MBW7475471.1 ABC transporter substrate-binding protein [Paenibacillus oenotherae]
MKKSALSLGLIVVLAMVLAACGGGNNEPAPASSNNKAENAGAANQKPSEEKADTSAQAAKRITYLDQEYELPASTERIVITGAVEAMEDSIVLDVKPVGAITFSGVFPPMFQAVTGEATSVGEKAEPNFETILSLKPDVILASTKFPAEVIEQLQKIAPTIPYSHIATNWEANLALLGELSGKQEQAAEAIAKYKSDLETARAELGDKMKDKKVIAARIRQGDIYLYPEKVFFNPVLYGDLGISVPEEVKAAKAQEAISIEKFAEMNPDYLFIQFSPDENKDTPGALEDLKNNPIMKSIKAFKNDAAFVNVVDPLAQGGTAYSKIEFLKAAVSSLSK